MTNQTHLHRHNHCLHVNVAYCSPCGLVYCNDCGFEWSNKWTGSWYWPNDITYTYTAGNNKVTTAGHTHGNTSIN